MTTARESSATERGSPGYFGRCTLPVMEVPRSGGVRPNGSGVCLVPVTRDRVLGNVVGPRHRGGRIAGQGVERRVWNSGGLGPFFNLTVSCPT